MSDRPHVLIIMTDQQRADSLGCAGHPVVRTPHMDRIAGEGVRFANAVTTCPICMPARASFVNGLYCHNHQMWYNAGAMPADDETFFHRLQAVGYATAHVGKSHYYPHAAGDHLRNHEPYMHARGLDYVHETTGPYATMKTPSYLTDYWGPDKWRAFIDDYNRRRADVAAAWASPLSAEDHADAYVGRQAVRYVEQRPDDRPTCLFVGFGGPHDPFDAPEPYATMYDPGQCPPAIPPEPVDGLPPAAAAYVGGRERYLKGRAEIPAGAAAGAKANYLGNIALIDEWIGRLLDAYAARGWLDNTLIVLWSDHGELLGDHGRFHKGVFYETAVRVPFLVRWPGHVPAGAVRTHFAQTIDAFNTIVEAAGAEPSPRSQGRSLLPVCRDADAPLRDAAFSEIACSGLKANGRARRTTMIRTDRYKYAVAEMGEPLMLFDLSADPDEQNNLVAEPSRASLRGDLDGLIGRWLLATQVCL